MTIQEVALAKARETWPAARIVTARKAHRCDYVRAGGINCMRMIRPGDAYIDPGESNPYRTGGLGGYRYCLAEFVGDGR